MFDTLPKTIDPFMSWDWSQIEPYYETLAARELTAATLTQWLADWTRLAELINERFTRLNVATSVNTGDVEAEQRLNDYLDTLYPQVKVATQKLNVKLTASGLQPDDFDVPLRHIRAQVELFRDENLPLQTQLQKLSQEYDKISGLQTVEWDGEEVTLQQLAPVFQDANREIREKAWHLEMNRRLQDRNAFNALWIEMVKLRHQIAQNTGFKSFRDYQWQALGRFDYTPDDCFTFHAAIEEVIVPVATRLYEKRRQRLGLNTLRPWDLDVDPNQYPPLRPFHSGTELEDRCEAIFQNLDPDLGKHFAAMRHHKLLDLENRKGKAPGGYCTMFDVERYPFIFMNAVGLHDDVQTMLHEAGHAFHVFETRHWPYIQQTDTPQEFSEVASMGMELLAAPYLTQDQGGFYSPADAARARVEHLQGIVAFWPYMAIVDAFQHWVYEHVDAASDPAQCDAKWDELSQRFMPGIDWTGLEAERVTGWQRKLHIFQVPFYYVEYGLAQLGAVQVWNNSLHNQSEALKAYRRALALGNTASLPILFATAGAKFAFDNATLQQAVELLETTINTLDPA